MHEILPWQYLLGFDLLNLVARWAKTGHYWLPSLPREQLLGLHVESTPSEVESRRKLFLNEERQARHESNK
jgi:hypothetical protein